MGTTTYCENGDRNATHVELRCGDTVPDIGDWGKDWIAIENDLDQASHQVALVALRRCSDRPQEELNFDNFQVFPGSSCNWEATHLPSTFHVQHHVTVKIPRRRWGGTCWSTTEQRFSKHQQCWGYHGETTPSCLSLSLLSRPSISSKPLGGLDRTSMLRLRCLKLK